MDVRGAVVAEYANNDREMTGSKCAAMLTVEEPFSWMVLELLTTLIVVRYIAKNKL
jgi:hypothetical protein